MPASSDPGEHPSLMPTYDRFDLRFERGEGVYLYDGDGSRYLDALAGIAVNVLGYAHPRLVDVGREAVEGVHHVSNLYGIEPQVRAAELLGEVAFESSVFFCNSGAEANEAAIKLARRLRSRPGRPGRAILSFENSFHGRTLGALSVTGQEKYREGFEPLVPEVRYATFNDPAGVEAAMDEQVCAVIVEPLQGEGGIHPADPAFMERIRTCCDRYESLFIVDEVQAGMGRTGRWFGYQHHDVQPDVITLAKGIAGGFPMGAMVARRSLREGFQPGDHASTFGGNPFVSRMAVEVLRTIREEELLANVRRVSDRLVGGLQDLSERYEPVGEPRGKGFMLGVPLEDSLAARAVVEEGHRQGLLMGLAGSNALRLVPPLILTERECDQLLDRLEAALEALT